VSLETAQAAHAHHPQVIHGQAARPPDETRLAEPVVDLPPFVSGHSPPGEGRTFSDVLADDDGARKTLPAAASVFPGGVIVIHLVLQLLVLRECPGQ